MSLADKRNNLEKSNKYKKSKEKINYLALKPQIKNKVKDEPYFKDRVNITKLQNLMRILNDN